MKMKYWRSGIPSTQTHLVTDDYGNEVFIGGSKSNFLAWYFLGLYEAIQQC